MTANTFTIKFEKLIYGSFITTSPRPLGCFVSEMFRIWKSFSKLTESQRDITQ